MKKTLYLLFLTLSISVKSQITEDFSISTTENINNSNYQLNLFQTTSEGYKYYLQNGTDSLLIYNLDGSIYRQVVLPQGWFIFTHGDNNGISLITDKLFNSDTLIEFLCQSVEYEGPNPPYTYTGGKLSVINELGQIVYTFPDTLTQTISLYSENGDFKLAYNYIDVTNNYDYVYKVFSLPGSLPCNQCNYSTGINQPNEGGGLSGLVVYPNPFNNSLMINYNFPTLQENPHLILTDITGRELETVQLKNQSDKITLNTTDLPKGTVIVSLYGNDNNPVSKKVIKIN